MKRRGKATITIDLLEATLSPRKKMRIMYRANLNYERFNRYFYEFLEKGFIEKTADSEGKACYLISSRGRKLLEALKTANDLGFSDEL